MAHHFGEAESVLGPEKLIRYSLLAGERALAIYAHEEALARFQQGLTAKGVPLEGSEPARDAESAALLFGLGRAKAATVERHEVREVVQIVDRAFDYYITSGDVRHAVDIAARPAVRQFTASAMSTGWSRIIEQALEMVPPNSLDAGRLLAQRAVLLEGDQGDYTAAQEALNHALIIAERNGDVALELSTLANATQVDLFNGSFQGCIEKGVRAIGLAGHVDDPRSEVLARYYTSVALAYYKGDLEGAQSHATAMLGLAEKLRDRQWLIGAFNIISILCLLEGSWERVRDYTDRGLSFSSSETSLLNARGKMEYQLGNFREGESCLDRLAAATKMSGAGPSTAAMRTAMLISLAAHITRETDRLADVAPISSLILSSAQARQFLIQEARAARGLMAVVASDIAVAGELYGSLHERAGTILGDGAMCGDRLLGLLTHTMGNLDQACEHFEEALAFCRKAGYRPELAWTCCDYSDSLLARHEPGDRQKAMSLLDECLRITRELGMKPLMERALSRRDILKA